MYLKLVLCVGVPQSCVHVDYFLLGVHVDYATHGAHGGYVVNISMTFNPSKHL
jgi:hypothetical protein